MAGVDVKGSGLSSIIDTVGQVGAVIITVVRAKENKALQEYYTQEIQKLRKEELEELAVALNNIQQQDKQIEFLANYLTNALSKRAMQDINAQINKDYLGNVTSEKKTIYWVLGGMVAFIGVIFLIKKFRK
jgi:23S rRNA maturation mini-RNase III